MFEREESEPIQYRNIRKNFLKNICAAFLCYLINENNRELMLKKLEEFGVKDADVFNKLQPNLNKVLNFNLFQ